MSGRCQLGVGATVVVAADAFIDPITHELMTDPVLAADGHVYDRASMQHWLSHGRLTSPRTNAPLAHGFLFPAWSHRQLMSSAPLLCAHLRPAADEQARASILGLSIGGLPPDQIVKDGIYAGMSVAEAQICCRWDEICCPDDGSVLDQIQRYLEDEATALARGSRRFNGQQRWHLARRLREQRYGLPLLGFLVGVCVGVVCASAAARR